MMRNLRSNSMPVLMLLATAVMVDARAQTPAQAVRHQADVAAAPIDATSANAPQDYCSAVQERISRAQFDKQHQELQDLAKSIAQQITALEERTAVLKEWIGKRDAYVQSAQDSLVQIYARMQQEAAASQLASMPEPTAAAILMKMETKRASAILGDMEAAKAGRVTAIIASIGDTSGLARSAADAPAKRVKP